jgi:diadenosine tetraphosphatase ApaH/serine/threonine PP2A family protein phosphatase
VEICHGSPFDEDAYIFDELDAVRALKTSQRPICLFGHTHWPVTFELNGGRVETIGASERWVDRLTLRPESKYMLNPGSVGQPRDGDPRAAYAIVDTVTMTADLIRVGYPIETTQAKVIKAGLPDVLAQRLAVGR